MPLLGPFEYGRNQVGAFFFRWASDNPLTPFLSDVDQAIKCPSCYWYRKIGLTTDVFPYTVVPGIAYFALGTPGPPPPRQGFELVGVKTTPQGG